MSSDSAADPSEMTSRSDRFNNHYTPTARWQATSGEA